MAISDETWAAIAPRSRWWPRVIAVLLALVVAGGLLWRAGLIWPRLSLTTVGYQVVGSGQLVLRVELRNDGWVWAEPTTSGWGWEGTGAAHVERVGPSPPFRLEPGAVRALDLTLTVPCSPGVDWGAIRMVAYGPAGGAEVAMPLREGVDRREFLTREACR